MVFLAVESENALTATENGAQLKEQFRLLSRQRSSLEMELPNAASGAAILKTPPPAAAGTAQIDKENLTLADRIRSPALDASYSKDQWRTIAIQAAARANGDIYAEWRDPLPIDALDMQPEGKTIFSGVHFSSCFDNEHLSHQHSCVHACLSIWQAEMHAATCRGLHEIDITPMQTQRSRHEAKNCHQKACVMIGRYATLKRTLMPED